MAAIHGVDVHDTPPIDRRFTSSNDGPYDVVYILGLRDRCRRAIGETDDGSVMHFVGVLERFLKGSTSRSDDLDTLHLPIEGDGFPLYVCIEHEYVHGLHFGNAIGFGQEAGLFRPEDRPRRIPQEKYAINTFSLESRIGIPEAPVGTLEGVYDILGDNRSECCPKKTVPRDL